MLTRRFLLTTAAAVALAGPAMALERLKVVASFSILGDMVGQIAGDRVDMVTLVGRDSDAHMFQPSPADARLIADAGLVVMNGLGFEGWMSRLIEAAGYAGQVVEASAGIEAISYEEDDHDDHGHAGHDHADGHKLGEAKHDHADGHKHGEAKHDHADGHKHGEAKHDHADGHKHGEVKHDHARGHDHGEFDPHAWQDVRLALTYASNIAAGLKTADPEGAEVYSVGLAAYLAELEALDAEIRALIETIPEDRRKVVTAHDSFAYFGRAYGLEFLTLQGVSTASEASAADVAALIRTIRAEGITAVFVENVSDNRLLEQITRETGAVIGGTLFSDALSMPVGPAPTYTAMMRHNAQQLVAALSGTN